ncbi:MAG: hypothetical protein Q9196_006858, partial [Gyalolechia fulgens]
MTARPPFLSSFLPFRPRTSIALSSPRGSRTTLRQQCNAPAPLPRNRQPPLPPQPQQHRPFTTALPLFKKQGGQGASKRAVAEKTANDNADPTDFSTFEALIEKVVTGLRDEIRKIRPGGLRVEDVEGVKVTLKKAGGPDKGAKFTVDAVEIAQVVPRGRVMVVLMGEKEHVKPLLTAFASSPLSINPLPPSADTPFELHIPIPPTTTESRQQALAQVSAKGEQALFALREARGAEKKRLNNLWLARK